jgi:hypothetical protein
VRRKIETHRPSSTTPRRELPVRQTAGTSNEIQQSPAAIFKSRTYDRTTLLSWDHTAWTHTQGVRITKQLEEKDLAQGNVEEFEVDKAMARNESPLYCFTKVKQQPNLEARNTSRPKQSSHALMARSLCLNHAMSSTCMRRVFLFVS